MMVVGDRYRLERELGTGGSAAVWLAHDLVLDRTTALKLLLPVDQGGDTRRERLRTEARALAALDHPNVVRVFDLGHHADRDYIVMEYLERGSLADRQVEDGPLAPIDAVDAVIAVLAGLEAAHAAGIVHRDVKPGNVLIRADGTVALCDFGIARTDLGSATRTGVALGSIGYMAPEQRIDARRVGPAADVYAAACTLYNLLTTDTPVDLYLAPDTSPRWEPVPAPLRPVVRRATRAEPSARFASAAEMAEALHAVRPSLAGLPPARIRSAASPLVGYVPTRGLDGHGFDADEPSVGADARVRGVGADDWGWSTRRTPVGRTALWVGTSVIVAATALGAALGPLRAELEPPGPSAPSGSASAEQGPVTAPPVAPPRIRLAGHWQGTIDGNPATLVLRGAPEVLDGEVVIQLGSHELRSRVHGRFDPAQQAVVLLDGAPAPSTWVATLNPSGLILDGELARQTGEIVPFAFVRTTGDPANPAGAPP